MTNESVRNTASADSGIGDILKFRRIDGFVSASEADSSSGAFSLELEQLERGLTLKQPSSPIAYMLAAQQATPVMLPLAANGAAARGPKACNAAVESTSGPPDKSMSPPLALLPPAAWGPPLSAEAPSAPAPPA
jgi:hypothetical protein